MHADAPRSACAAQALVSAGEVVYHGRRALPPGEHARDAALASKMLSHTAPTAGDVERYYVGGSTHGTPPNGNRAYR